MSTARVGTLPSTGKRTRDTLLTLLGLGLLAAALYVIDGGASTKFRQACALFAIWGVAATSLNLINGTTGILSLGHHGFMLIGGYTTALLTLPEVRRQQIADSARSQMTDFTLGLSLSKRIIEQYHQGQLFVKHSEPGRGTTFRIVLNK